MNEARSLTGWLQYHISPRNLVVLSTNTSADEEVFSALEYVSEIPSVGIDFMKSRGIKNPKGNYYLFQSFIRQGKTFYEAGTKLHFRASALMYYYSFLNLAKAYISINDPPFVSQAVGHGLTQGQFSPSQFSKQTVHAPHKPGVFHKFYELEIGSYPPKNLRLNISNLLGYCSDVKYEYLRGKFGFPKLLPVNCRFFSHRTRKESWPVVAVVDFHLIERYKKSLNQFNNYFENVEINREIAREVFDINAANHKIFTFFQSRNTYKENQGDQIEAGKIKSDVLDACGGIYQSRLYDDKFDFRLSIPMRLNSQTPFNEPLAIYVLMFYIGSLVRYHPDYLENLLNSKNAWIIERFVRSSATTFLRYIANVILQTDYIYIVK